MKAKTGFASMFWAVLIAFGPEPAAASEPVDLELVLAVDVSSSVSDAEYRLQMGGIAAAFRDPLVIAAIEGSAFGIAVSVIQWSGPLQQQTYLDWRRLTRAQDAEAVAEKVDIRSRAFVGGTTAIGSMIDKAIIAFERNRYAGRRQVVDLAGDGASNQGGEPQEAATNAVSLGITINGLAVANEEPGLGSYYYDHVIGGPGAFVITITDFDDYALAMRDKLLVEILGGAVSVSPGHIPGAPPG